VRTYATTMLQLGRSNAFYHPLPLGEGRGEGLHRTMKNRSGYYVAKRERRPERFIRGIDAQTLTLTLSQWEREDDKKFHTSASARGTTNEITTRSISSAAPLPARSAVPGKHLRTLHTRASDAWPALVYRTRTAPPRAKVPTTNG
jgi:hypothetical protein